MSVWRRKAIEACPDIREDLEAAPTCMQAWFDLLPMLRLYERDNDTRSALPIYSYAKWCWDQTEHQNDVAVAFYEHLVDESATRSVIPVRLRDQSLFGALVPLFEDRLSRDQLIDLLTAYDLENKSKFASKYAAK